MLCCPSRTRNSHNGKTCQIDDATSILLARDIAKKIEAEMEYPGQIKVVIIRETRAVDYAK